MRGARPVFFKMIKLRSRKIADAAKMSPYFCWRKESNFFQRSINFLRPTNLIALDMSESIVGSVFIHLGECRIIKTAVDEKFRSLSKKQGSEARVDQIGRLLTNAVNADEGHVLSMKEEF